MRRDHLVDVTFIPLLFLPLPLLVFVSGLLVSMRWKSFTSSTFFLP
jgi:hypothetical protein